MYCIKRNGELTESPFRVVLILIGKPEPTIRAINNYTTMNDRTDLEVRRNFDCYTATTAKGNVLHIDLAGNLKINGRIANPDKHQDIGVEAYSNTVMSSGKYDWKAVGGIEVTGHIELVQHPRHGILPKDGLNPTFVKKECKPWNHEIALKEYKKEKARRSARETGGL